MSLSLRDRSERNEVYTDENQLRARGEELPELLKKVAEAKEYFLHMKDQAIAGPIDIKDVNTGFIYTLDECIDVLDKKNLKHNGLMSTYYAETTGRDKNEYSGTLKTAKLLTKAFFDPKWNKNVRKMVQGSEGDFLERDRREQAYRICDFVLDYFGVMEAGYESFSGKTKKELVDILGTKIKTIIKHNFPEVTKN